MDNKACVILEARRGEYRKMNYKVLLQYDGTRYDGWQKQGNTEKTIQGKMEILLERITGEQVAVHGAGRTDAGVHALGQVANFHIKTDMNEEELRSKMNRYLPEDIEVIELIRVPERFHSRLNAVRKTYRYVISEDGKHVFERKYLWNLNQTLDLEAMKQAAEKLIGTQDFKSFCANKKMKKSTVRTIYEIGIRRENGKVILEFVGSGFLYHMVRILTGTLVEVGLHRRKLGDIPRIIEGKNRALAGITAPAEGLTLVSVEYEQEKEYAEKI